jgi:hypothetical protein
MKNTQESPREIKIGSRYRQQAVFPNTTSHFVTPFYDIRCQSEHRIFISNQYLSLSLSLSLFLFLSLFLSFRNCTLEAMLENRSWRFDDAQEHQLIWRCSNHVEERREKERLSQENTRLIAIRLLAEINMSSHEARPVVKRALRRRHVQ